MQALSGQHWGIAFRSLFLCTAVAAFATVTTRFMVRSARSQSLLQPARWSFLVGYAVVGAFGFFAVDAYLDAPVEAGLWGGLFLVYLVDSLICRFAFPGKSE